MTNKFNKVYTFHYPTNKRTLDGNRFTFCMGKNTNGIVCVAVSNCCASDQFVKRTGRAKAMGRLIGKAKKYYLEPTDFNYLMRYLIIHIPIRCEEVDILAIMSEKYYKIITKQ